MGNHIELGTDDCYNIHLGSSRVDKIYLGGNLVFQDAYPSTLDYPDSQGSGVSHGTDNYGIFFDPTGTLVYLSNYVGDTVKEYPLSTAWDLTSASTTPNSTASFTLTHEARCIHISPDGKNLMMIVTTTGADSVHKYTMSTAWDLSTINTTAAQTLTLNDTGVGTNLRGLSFSPDGKHMYTCDIIEDEIYQYDLTTGWDLSTASYINKVSLSSGYTGPSDIFIHPNGKQMWWTTYQETNEIAYGALSTAWDITTLSPSYGFNILSGPFCNGLFMKPDGSELFLVSLYISTLKAFTTS